MVAISKHTILKSKWLWLWAIILVLAGLRSAHNWSEDHFILINQTQSLPNWIFIVDKGVPPQRGDMVAFTPGPNPYYPENLPFVKIVRGVSGDAVSIEGVEVAVNGERLGAIKSLTGANPNVTAIDPGTIPNGQYFVWSPSPDSFDSRYKEIGYVEDIRIIGRARPLL
ncbi:MAG: S26 family signal peptidase [Pseudomonadota bacterium]